MMGELSKIMTKLKKTSFRLKKNTLGRLGSLQTRRASIKSPAFFPDATRGFLKNTSWKELRASGTKAMVVNTFHLHIQGLDTLVAKQGGLQAWQAQKFPLLSDSGGFQAFSLINSSAKLGKIDDDKISFKSPLDGSKHELTPEKSIEIQFNLGTDIMVALDDCPPNDWPREKIEKSVFRSLAWAKRSKQEFIRQIKKRKISEADRPLLLAVVQGGKYLDLRKLSADALIEIGFDGYGFGGRPVDEDNNFLAELIFKTASYLPEHSFRFALGLGLPEDIYRAYIMSWDFFDCVIPSREGRHAKIYSFKKNFHSFKKEKFNVLKEDYPDFYKTENLLSSKFATDFSPINSESKIEELRSFTKSNLHFLFKQRDTLAARLASLNNLEFYQELILKLRELGSRSVGGLKKNKLIK